MNLDPHTEAGIDERIRRLSRGPRAAAARDELKAHILEATRESARGQRVTQAHVDGAFASLGSDQEIREAFFPGKPRVRLGLPSVAILVAASALVVAAGLADGGGTASCQVEGPGECSARSSGQAADLVLTASLPLLVLACLVWLPAWSGAALAAAYLVLAFLRATSGWGAGNGFDMAFDLSLACAAVACAAVAGRQMMLSRRAADA